MSHKIEIFASVDGQIVHPPIGELTNVENYNTAHTEVKKLLRTVADRIDMTRPLFRDVRQN